MLVAKFWSEAWPVFNSSVVPNIGLICKPCFSIMGEVERAFWSSTVLVIADQECKEWLLSFAGQLLCGMSKPGHTSRYRRDKCPHSYLSDDVVVLFVVAAIFCYPFVIWKTMFFRFTCIYFFRLFYFRWVSEVKVSPMFYLLEGF